MRVIDEGYSHPGGTFRCEMCARVVRLERNEPVEADYYRKNDWHDAYLQMACPNCEQRTRYEREPWFARAFRDVGDDPIGWFRSDDRRVKVALVLVAYLAGLLS